MNICNYKNVLPFDINQLYQQCWYC